MSTNLAAETPLEHDTTLTLHLCYLVVLLTCSLAYRRIEPVLRKPVVLGLLSAVAVLALAPVLLVLLGMIDPFFYLPCIVVAAGAKALLFLSWMMVFSAIYRERSGLVLMLGSMTLGWMLCLVVAGAAPFVAAIATCLMPAISGGCLVAIVLGDAACDIGGNRSRASDATPLFRLLPPLFMVGLVLYEFAPGFVTGTLRADGGTDALIHTYAAVALLLALALGAVAVLMRFEAGKRYATRFVIPIIAVGLLSVPLLGPGEQALAFACVIAGTSVFDAFIYSSFARRVQGTGVSSLRLISWGQLVIQAALLAAYGLGGALAKGASWVSGICLALVFLIIVGGRFDLYSGTEHRVVTGEPAEPVEPEPAVSGEKPHQVLGCASFAEENGYSKREREILGLVAKGFNAPAIAERLSIAPSTVKTHLAHMYRKASVANRQELVRKLEEHDRP